MSRNWLAGNPLFGFFALAFGISWGGILLILAVTGFAMSALQPVEGGLIFLAMLLGPSVSGLVFTAGLEGRAGLRRLAVSAGHWRVAARWYAVAMLTIPALLLLILAVLATFADPAFAPQFHWTLLGVGLVAGAFEEIGWTGFATPRFLAGRGLGAGGLIIGLLWAVWHLPVDVRYNLDTMGAYLLLEFAIVYLATLTPYRLLMTWVYSNTQSLLLAVLMHASFTGWLLALFPATTLLQSLIWQSVFALVLWVMAAVVLVLTKARHFDARRLA